MEIAFALMVMIKKHKINFVMKEKYMLIKTMVVVDGMRG